MHTNAEVDDQQKSVRVSNTSTRVAFLHDWLERGVWTEPPTDLSKAQEEIHMDQHAVPATMNKSD